MSEAVTPKPASYLVAGGEVAHPADRKSLLMANGGASLISRHWNGRIIKMG